MKEIEQLIQTLSPNERIILQYLQLGSVSKISKELKIDDTAVKRALEYLANKNIVKIELKQSKIITLGDNGALYFKHELPERKLLNALANERDKKLTLKNAREKSNLSENELSISLGVLKGKELISLSDDIISLTAKEHEIGKKLPEEKFLEILPINFSQLSDEQKFAFENLRKRKDIVRLEETKELSYEITHLGNELLKNLDKVKEASNLIETLTPDILMAEAWKNKKFRHYDITSKVPSISGGKQQPYYEFLQDTREHLLSLGFKEAEGPLVELSFFNSDALFMPQDHPARGIHDIYFVKQQGDISKYRKLVNEVRKAHENGGKTGSEGWKTEFSEKIASKLVLRSQGTAVSARILSQPHEMPGKYFSIARCYRPDIIDASHNTEFNQIEGIVIDESLNLKNLLGLLKSFAENMAGSKKIKFVPAYFPFTEPSVEVHIYHEKLGKWIELGGAGIFRPELTGPLGVKGKVLAWGLGLDRLYMIKNNITDIRQIFSTNLEFLRGK